MYRLKEIYGKKAGNLDSLEVESFNIESIAPTQTKISIFLKNISSEDVSNLNLAIYLVDKNENHLAKFKAYISTIVPNETNKITINTEKNLSLVTDLLVCKYE